MYLLDAAPEAPAANTVSALLLSLVMGIGWTLVRWLDKRKEAEAPKPATADTCDQTREQVQQAAAEARDAHKEQMQMLYSIRESTNRIWNQSEATHKRVGGEVVPTLDTVAGHVSILKDRSDREGR